MTEFERTLQARSGRTNRLYASQEFLELENATTHAVVRAGSAVAVLGVSAASRFTISAKEPFAVAPAWLLSAGSDPASLVHVRLLSANAAADAKPAERVVLRRMSVQALNGVAFDKEAIAAILVDQLVLEGGLFAHNCATETAIFQVVCVKGEESSHNSDQLFRVKDSTEIMESRAMEKVTGVQTYAGYERQKGELAKILDSSLFHHDIHARLGIKPSKTVLLTGLSGVGKSALIHSTLHELDLSAHTVDILDLALFLNGTEKQGISISEQLVCPLSKAILRARACPPAVVILEGLDHIGAELIGTGIDMSLCAVRISSILSRMNEDSDSNHVCILATCRDDQKLPAVLSRFGLFGLFHTRICLEAPSREERKMMYQCLLEGVLQSSDDTDLLAQATSGFLARDMSNLIQRAKMNAELHYCPEIDTIVTDVHRLSIVPSFNADQRLGKEKLSWTLDFFPALQIVESCQTADTEFQVSKSILKWDSIGGYEEAIKKLKSLVLNPLENPASYERLKVKPPSGILLYGPSGCGKSLLVRTLAANSPLNFISVNGSKIFSKYLGDSESKVRKVFELARQIAPSIIFFDEIDILGTRREWTEDGASGVNERVLSTLLNEMDGVSEQNGVIVIGATSRPEKLDDALLRPGRLDHHLYIPLPDIHDRHEILRKLMLRKCELDFSRIAKVTDGFTPADLEVLIREAGYLCLRERDIDGSAATTDMQWKHISAALSGAMKGSMGSIFEAAFDRDIDGDEDAGAELSFWNSFGSGGMDTWCVSMLSQSTAETGEVQKILGLRGDSRPKTGWWSPGSCSKNDAEKFEIFQKGSRK